MSRRSPAAREPTRYVAAKARRLAELGELVLASLVTRPPSVPPPIEQQRLNEQIEFLALRGGKARAPDSGPGDREPPDAAA